MTLFECHQIINLIFYLQRQITDQSFKHPHNWALVVSEYYILLLISCSVLYIMKPTHIFV